MSESQMTMEQFKDELKFQFPVLHKYYVVPEVPLINTIDLFKKIATKAFEDQLDMTTPFMQEVRYQLNLLNSGKNWKFKQA